jgi:Tfp pilus assembly protein PilO
VKKIKLSDRDRRAVRLLAAALAGIAAVWFVVLPFFSSWASARDRAAAAEAQIAELEVKIDRLMRQRARLSYVYGPSLQKALPTAPAARLSVIKNATDALTAAGLKSQSLQPRPNQRLRNAPGLVLVPIQVQAAGGYQQVVTLLSNLAKSETLIIVDRIDVTGAKGTFTFSLSTLAIEGAQP